MQLPSRLAASFGACFAVACGRSEVGTNDGGVACERDDPVSHWSLDERSGPVAHDEMGRNHGAWVGDPAPTDGMVDGGLSLAGNGQHVRVPSHPTLDPGSGDFSVAAWVRTTYLGGSANDFVLAKHRTGSAVGYLIVYDAAGQLQGTGIPWFRVADGQDWYAAAGTSSITDGAWHHVAGVRQGTALWLFVDGVRAGSGEAPATLDIRNPNDFIIGGRDHSGGDPYLRGGVDEVVYYDRALSDDEIGNLASGDPIGCEGS